jgi:hypothetical protein
MPLMEKTMDRITRDNLNDKPMLEIKKMSKITKTIQKSIKQLGHYSFVPKKSKA